MLAYLFNRLRALNWQWWQIVVFSAVVRGAYHLYQGFGGGIGNVVMGLVFGYLYLRWRRVGPLVVAHVILDLVSFIGYASPRTCTVLGRTPSWVHGLCAAQPVADPGRRPSGTVADVADQLREGVLGLRRLARRSPQRPWPRR